MLIFDCHADTLGKWTDGEVRTHFDKSAVKGKYIQVFAAFIGQKGSCWERVNRLIDTYDELTGFFKIKTRADVESIRSMAYSVLAVEGGDLLEGKRERLFKLFERGVRILTFTWNNENCLAGAALSHDNGLKAFGREILAACEEIGITADLSHMGDRSFYDALANAKKPVIVSHSCSRALANVPRNITDEQFLLLKENGGCLGINFYPKFLKADGTEKNTSADDIIRHIDHFLSLGGEENLGLGTDFDGIDCLPDGIDGTSSLYTFCEKLNVLYGADVAEKITGENFLRVLRGNLP